MLPHLYQGLHIDKAGLQKVKNMSQDSQTRIIFMPLYKSNADIALLHYANYFLELEQGFSFGYFETDHWSTFTTKMMKAIGIIPIQKSDSEVVVQNLMS